MKRQKLNHTHYLPTQLSALRELALLATLSRQSYAHAKSHLQREGMARRILKYMQEHIKPKIHYYESNLDLSFSPTIHTWDLLRSRGISDMTEVKLVAEGKKNGTVL